ncbi:MAG TPA: Tol-Pal system beta propeller repeat protein TolB [Candidatus Limnocylindria bacterium]|nr:Tol-Pal system beta propeller repeat protein TolB [Candidatus Limnocylindria bacterium]
MRWVAVSLACLGAVRSAPAVVSGDIYGPGSTQIPLASVPLKGSGDADAPALGARFASILAKDLELSGYFKALDPRSFPERPDTMGLTADTTDFTAWNATGAQDVVKGAITVNGGRVQLEARMFDVPSQVEVSAVGRRFEGSAADVPRMAHRMADTILEYLTGERGPFDSQILFTSRRGGPLKDVYVFDFDGDPPRRLTNERAIVVAPRWHPSGDEFLFVSYRRHLPQLYRQALGSRTARSVVSGRVAILNGAWSPDGSKLLVARDVGGNTDIYLLDSAGKPLRRLTDHWGIDVSPTWAPDGRHFAFCSSRSGSPQIYVMDIDGGGLRRVSFHGSYNTSPAWAPKGDRIAYTTRQNGFQIVVAGADGTGGRLVTRDGVNEDPSWAPDGRYLVFSARRGGRRVLVMTDREGRMQRELTTGQGDDTSPAWSPRRDY